MPNSEKYEDFKEGFLEYREFDRFKALADEQGLKRFAALCSLVYRAEKQLSICYARDVDIFADEIQEILLKHREAVQQGDHKSAYIPTMAMDDGPGELAILKEIFEQEKQKENGSLDCLLMWGLKFAVFALMKVVEAVEAINDQMAADAAIDSMDSVGFAENIDLQWASVRIAEQSDRAKKELRDASISAVRIRELEAASRKRQLSMAGKIGAQSLHRPVAELKAWALSQAKSRRGSHKDIARHLAKQIPRHLENVSKDPTRLIYDTLRASIKPI